MKPTIVIDLLKDLPRKFPGRRPQPWRYLISDAGNGAVFERSSERLTNRGDAIEAIEDVHGPDATVVLREEGQPDRIIRRPYPYPGMDGTTIIGPECFAADDGSVLMWRGQDYVPRPSRRIDLSETELNRILAELEQRIVSAPVTNLAVLARVIQIINEVITEHEDHVHAPFSERVRHAFDIADAEELLRQARERQARRPEGDH